TYERLLDHVLAGGGVVQQERGQAEQGAVVRAVGLGEVIDRGADCHRGVSTPGDGVGGAARIGGPGGAVENLRTTGRARTAGTDGNLRAVGHSYRPRRDHRDTTCGTARRAWTWEARGRDDASPS